MGGRSECLTLNLSEGQEQCRNGEGECSLSQVLEVGKLPERFYLSARACRGILRRALRRGKSLPPALQKALEEKANSEPENSSEADETEE